MHFFSCCYLPCTGALELIEESFDSKSVCVLWLLEPPVEWYVPGLFIFSVCISFQCFVCVYALEFYVECLNSRQGENEFQLFLFLRTPAKSAVEGPQGVHRPGSVFYLRTLRGDSNCVLIGKEC